jgi:uncharacterized protein YtpQ (UPF0354 family)
MWNQNNFDERQVPPMSTEMFSTLVTARLRPVQGVEVVGGKGLQLKLRILGLDTTAQLERAYERYRANPDAVNSVIDQLIDGLVNGIREESGGNAAFAAVREKLLPRLMTAQQWMDKRDEGLRLVIRSFVQDLGAALILDHGDSFEYVQLDSIPTWEIDSPTAYETAYENLERTTRGVAFSVNGERLETLLIDHSNNASARILSPMRLSDWESRIEGDLILGMPTHDLLLGFSRQHPAFADLHAQIVADAANSSNALMPNLLLVRQGALELFA